MTLNIKETEKLRAAMVLFDKILTQGYNPETESSTQKAQEIKKTRRELHEVWARKGKFSG